MRKLAKPRKVRVTPYLTVTRVYADVWCADGCGFHGAPHRRNFANEGVVGGPRFPGDKRTKRTRPVCHACMKKRRERRQLERAAKVFRVANNRKTKWERQKLAEKLHRMEASRRKRLDRIRRWDRKRRTASLRVTRIGKIRRQLKRQAYVQV